MIIWLASYPRSGNTLLRTVINRTMHMKSISDEFDEVSKYFNLPKLQEITGSIQVDGGWKSFYETATESDEIFLVKTHSLPRDNQPAIYIVRDGRKAMTSYSKFHESFTAPPYPTLMDLLLGLDYYGDWSAHVQTWAQRENTIVLKYEELVEPSDVLLRKIADFVDYQGAIAPWENPFNELQGEAPKFFREGNSEWQGGMASWSPLLESIFLYCHGETMRNFGYVAEKNVAAATAVLNAEVTEIIQISRRLNHQVKLLQNVCDERLAVIDGLKQECDKRLTLIESLSNK